MWKEENEQTLQEAIEHISSILSKLNGEFILPLDILNLVQIQEQHIIDLLTSIVSGIYKTPEFLLDMAPKKTTQEVSAQLKEIKEQIQNFIQLQKHPDNLPELLYGQREFGCVYLPTELLKRIYVLGESVLDYTTAKQKDPDLDKKMLQVMMLASEWVEYSKRKWGKMPDSELAVISPLTSEEVRTAHPDTETPPPF